MSSCRGPIVCLCACAVIVLYHSEASRQRTPPVTQPGNSSLIFISDSKDHYILFTVVIFRPHRSTTYADAAYCYRPSCVVCLYVCHSTEPCKTAEPIELPFGFRTLVGSWNPVLDGGPDPPTRSGNLKAGEASHCKVYGHFAVVYGGMI